MDLDTMVDMATDMSMARGKLRLSPTTMVDSMAMDLDTMEDMAMDMSMARGKPRLRLSPTTMVDSTAMDLDTMEDMAMDMSMARGKPKLRPSLTTMVDIMVMDSDTMEDMAMDLSMASEHLCGNLIMSCLNGILSLSNFGQMFLHCQHINVCFCSIGYKTVNYTKSILPNMLSPSKTCYCTSMYL